MKEINSIKDCYKIRGNNNIHWLIEMKQRLISNKKYGFLLFFDAGHCIHMKSYEPFNK